MLTRSFVSRDSELWKRLYTIYVRPHLEYAVAAWNPYLKKDKAIIERVQRRATKIPICMKKFNYEQRCEALEITSLEQRRIRGDLIQQFKIIKGLDHVTWHAQPLCISTRDGHVKLHREKSSNCDPRFHFFTNRIANEWNSLPSAVILADTTDGFKNRYDNWIWNGAKKRIRSRKSFCPSATS